MASVKMKIAVLFGGKSVEHEVSIISGLQAYTNLDREKYDPVAVYIDRNGDMFVGDDIGKITSYKGDIAALTAKSTRVVFVGENDKTYLVRYPAKHFGSNIVAEIDAALPVVHGTNVEDGNLAGFLHSVNCPFVGCDVLSAALGMDKYAAKVVMKAAGIPVLDCVLIKRRDYLLNVEDYLARVEEQTRYPVIVKPVNLGSSVGIKKAHDRASLAEALEYAFEFADRVLVENAVVKLREINCSVLGDKDSARASECEEPISRDEILSYADKYKQGGAKGGAKSAGMADTKRLLPAPITAEQKETVRRLAVEAFSSLGCSGVARIDFLLDDESGALYVNEINTIPGSLSFYLWEASGLTFSAMLDELIRLALKRKREESLNRYSFETDILSGASFGGAKGKA